MPSSARCTNSRAGQPAAAKRGAAQCDDHPDEVGTIRHGTAVANSQKPLARPKARQNRRLHRSADPRRARRATAPERAKRLFLFHRARRILFLGKTKRGPRRAPRGGERRSKGAGAVFAAGGNGAERTLRRRQWGAHPAWTMPPGGSQTPVANLRRPAFGKACLTSKTPAPRRPCRASHR